MKKMWFCTVLAIAGLAACGKPAAPGRDGELAPSGKPRVIGAALLTQTHVFYQDMVSAMKEAADAEGFTLQVQYAEFDLRKQNDQMELFVTQGVDAIILSPADSAGAGPAIAEARKAGIPVFTADIAAKGGEVVSHIASDNFAGGKLVGEYLAKLLNNKGKVAIIDHPAVESAQQRTLGFEEAIKAFPEMSVVAHAPGEGQRDKALKAAQDLIQAHPDLAGIFGINDDSALGALAAVEEAGKQDSLIIVGFDGTEEALKAIKRGSALKADAAQFPREIGQTTIKTIAAYFRGEKVDPVVPVNVKIIDQQTLKTEQGG